jgi:hypothetical protein
VWAADFQFDVTTDGRPIKIVSIVDEHTRECLGGMVERSITGEHLITELDRVAAERSTLEWLHAGRTSVVMATDKAKSQLGWTPKFHSARDPASTCRFP